MKAREHRGRVIEVENDQAVVRLETDQQCGLHLKCACCGWSAREPRLIRVSRDDLALGDAVRVFIPAYAGYLSILLVFVLPVVLFVAGLIVGGQLEDGSGAHGMPTVVGGVVGFAVAVLVAAFVNRRLMGAGSVGVVRLGPGDPPRRGPGGA